jgi:hypothetical protein
MKKKRQITVKGYLLAYLSFLVMMQQQVLSQETLLSVQRDTGSGSIQLRLVNPDMVAQSGAWLQLQRSTDLIQWEDLVAAPSSAFATPDSSLVYEETGIGNAFFRLLINQRVVATASTTASGDVLFGFAQSFAAELKKVGQLSVKAFLERYSDDVERLDAITFDVADAEPKRPLNIMSRAEYAIFQKNGMVVSGQWGSHSFVDAYYEIFKHDEPVFITADSILHAWHLTYVEMLSELEDFYFSPRLSEFLFNTHKALPQLASELDPAVFADSLNDVDYFLAVATSLLVGGDLAGELGASSAEVKETLNAIRDKQVGPFSIFGRQGPNEWMDFSQFTPRGHYASSRSLSRYFQAAMWCGRVDFRVAGPEEYSSPRELGSALILNELAKRSGALDIWTQLDEILQVFVGVSDSMGFAQLDRLQATFELPSLQEIESLSELETLQRTIENGDFGDQQILSHPFVATHSGPPLTLPRSFAVFGQKFVMDSWALSNLVFDRLLWDGKKVSRRLPSALDVAFTVFGNRNAADLLADRIQRSDGVPFRDGYPVQHHLAALHEVFGRMPEGSWNQSIYTGWLGVLRELSTPADVFGGHVPQAFRTKAWANRVMNTQLGSWTELRHDTVLYAKQSSTPPVLCSFPYSYLEPSLGFWDAMQSLAARTRMQLESMDRSGGVTAFHDMFGPISTTLRILTSNQIKHLQTFESTLKKLRGIAAKQQQGLDLDRAEELFLADMVEIMLDYVGERTYSGWYPKLYYHPSYTTSGENFPGSPGYDVHAGDKWDALVTDVHTDYPDQQIGDPGTILMQGVGNVGMMFVAIDCEDDGTRHYSGPVYTHYEFTSGEGKFERMTDEQWKRKVKGNNVPSLPEWTEDFFVPGNVRIPSWADKP